MIPPRPQRLRARVVGRVQGVGFRAFVYERASGFGLSGSVRNLRDGSVGVEAEGPRERLEEFLRALRRGPPAARVEGIEIEWIPPTGSARFEIRPT